jgi:hypothetical protein
MWQLAFITWYSQFLMNQYNDPKWIKHFKANIELKKKKTMKFKSLHGKKDTCYRCAVLVGIRIACSLYMFAHQAKFL